MTMNIKLFLSFAFEQVPTHCWTPFQQIPHMLHLGLY